MGALAGGAVVGCMGLGAITLGEAFGLWRAPLPSAPGLLALFYLGFAISCSPIYLITWRPWPSIASTQVTCRTRATSASAAGQVAWHVPLAVRGGNRAEQAVG